MLGQIFEVQKLNHLFHSTKEKRGKLENNVKYSSTFLLFLTNNTGHFKDFCEPVVLLSSLTKLPLLPIPSFLQLEFWFIALSSISCT